MCAPERVPGSGERPGARHVVLGSGDMLELATPGTRLAGRVADTVVVVVPFAALHVIWAVWAGVDALASPSVSVRGALMLAGLVVNLCYEAGFVAVRGQTPGKRWVGIKVVTSETGAVPGWGQALGRWALPYLLSAVLGFVWASGYLLGWVCYLSLIWGRDLQGWHDRAARTLVVRSPRGQMHRNA